MKDKIVDARQKAEDNKKRILTLVAKSNESPELAPMLLEQVERIALEGIKDIKTMINAAEQADKIIEKHREGIPSDSICRFSNIFECMVDNIGNKTSRGKEALVSQLTPEDGCLVCNVKPFVFVELAQGYMCCNCHTITERSGDGDYRER